MQELPAGNLLPRITTVPPGPRSRALTRDLRAYESPNITFISDDSPIFWQEALGANVLDVDGNIYIDLTAGFGVAAAGHRNPKIASAVQRQFQQLAHGLGDVHPPEIKTRLLRRLAEITPPGLSQTILANSGSEAVEAALKTARLATGKPGVLCFSGAYHGLTYGALAVSDGPIFREPFSDQLGIPIVRAPFPDPYRPPNELGDSRDLAATALEIVRHQLDSASDRIGAVIVEPIQGRGGIVIPPDTFLPGLRSECDRRGILLIFDEVYTGFGRTGRWFACEHQGVVPDLLCLGKALSGALPISACVGRPEVMAAWPPSGGAAIHTSTFLGHPPACAAALAQIDELTTLDLVPRAARLGEALLSRLSELQERQVSIGHVRGRGLMIGLELVSDRIQRRPDRERAARVCKAALRHGVIVLADGRDENVLSITPPLTITEEQLDFSLAVLEDCLANA